MADEMVSCTEVSVLYNGHYYPITSFKLSENKSVGEFFFKTPSRHGKFGTTLYENPVVNFSKKVHIEVNFRAKYFTTCLSERSQILSFVREKRSSWVLVVVVGSLDDFAIRYTDLMEH